MKSDFKGGIYTFSCSKYTQASPYVNNNLHIVTLCEDVYPEITRDALLWNGVPCLSFVGIRVQGIKPAVLALWT